MYYVLCTNRNITARNDHNWKEITTSHAINRSLRLTLHDVHSELTLIEKNTQLSYAISYDNLNCILYTTFTWEAYTNSRLSIENRDTTRAPMMGENKISQHYFQIKLLFSPLHADFYTLGNRKTRNFFTNSFLIHVDYRSCYLFFIFVLIRYFFSDVSHVYSWMWWFRSVELWSSLVQ